MLFVIIFQKAKRSLSIGIQGFSFHQVKNCKVGSDPLDCFIKLALGWPPISNPNKNSCQAYRTSHDNKLESFSTALLQINNCEKATFAQYSTKKKLVSFTIQLYYRVDYFLKFIRKQSRKQTFLKLLTCAC